MKHNTQFVHLLLLFLGELDLQGLLCTVSQNIRQLLLAGDHVGTLGALTMELNGTEFTLGSADTAADALVGVNDGCAAAQASCRFCLDLLFREGELCIPEGLLVVNILTGAGDLTGGVVFS